jgi:pimeloyl-ACP methyl ester carboxylesterase
MARFLLIHGAGHGAWCWRDVLPALRALGHEAQALDLPSHGSDPTPVARVTLDLYADAILGALERDTVLVGHSMGGFPISLVAERAPDSIARLVYLCAHTPWEGMSLAQMRKLVDDQPLVPAMMRSADGLSVSFDPAMVRDLFYHDCPPGTLEYALTRLCPQAIAPQSTAVDLGAAYASVPRSYVICEDDRAIPPALQEQLAARFAPGEVYRMACGHSPFFADPEGLAALLDRITA